MLFNCYHMIFRLINSYKLVLTEFLKPIVILMSSKNLGKPLTVDLVFTKTKSDSLNNIKNLNLWGNDLEDLKLIQKMPNLQVVSLSVNRISTLRDFSKCVKLQELYLRKNNISDLKEIKFLTKLPSLKVLWLHDNPCSQVPNYRQIAIKYLPNLMKLDNNPITPEQRIAAEKVSFNLGGYDQNEAPGQIYSNKQFSQIPQQYQQKVQARQKSFGEQKWNKNKPSTSAKKQRQVIAPSEQISRNQNILMAVLSLMRQLDQGSLEIIRRQSQNMLK